MASVADPSGFNINEGILAAIALKRQGTFEGVNRKNCWRDLRKIFIYGEDLDDEDDDDEAVPESGAPALISKSLVNFPMFLCS
ncbi:unnamed protein product [Notodromas monacha]|uniref:Uncharacterized protein n=1 Tax=Notodromas monacha TaxID=399045 RepID=A0A7R9GGM3_9CRUS|nr:unnamed protein product [Notodromas monacha]CAG0921992.1 unnamed protein product [Notodromas monacha]